MALARYSDSEGITVKELKAILADLPETDADGDEAIIYLLVGNAHISPLTEIVLDDEKSSIFCPEFHLDTMVELGCYTDFFGLQPEGFEDEDDDEEEGE